jgi:hypothetical protein
MEKRPFNKTKKKNLEFVTFRIDSELLEATKKLAENEDRTVSSFIRHNLIKLCNKK